ncbi:Uncharacterised protein [Mycobacteroides abscessus subsp. abscessus]|nr:Uncharacterised protein [Mycobacteroides abscessus subsp. abscessus]
MLSRPCAVNARASKGLVSMESRRLLAIEPNAIPPRKTPNPHPVISPRCSCPFSPTTVLISGALGFSPREGSTPASYWRCPSSRCAVSISASVVPSSNRKGHQRRSTKGRICWAHANGENQLSALPLLSMMSPRPRTTTAAAKAAMAAPLAARAVRHSCAVTAPTPAKTMEAPVIPRLMPRLLVKSKPAADNAAVMATARKAFIRATTIRAA